MMNRTKKIQTAFCLGAVVLVWACAPAVAVSGPWKDGAYPGVASGHNGPVQVAVVVRNGRIDRAEVVRHKERNQKAMNSVVRKIVAEQSVEVDAISGATISSKAVMSAVKNALEQAH